MQADRFLATLWSIHYKTRVNTTRAITASSLSFLLSIISLLYTRPSNIALEGIPRLLAVAATVGVSIYGIIVDRRLERLQPGPVNLPFKKHIGRGT